MDARGFPGLGGAARGAAESLRTHRGLSTQLPPGALDCSASVGAVTLSFSEEIKVQNLKVIHAKPHRELVWCSWENHHFASYLCPLFQPPGQRSRSRQGLLARAEGSAAAAEREAVHSAAGAPRRWARNGSSGSSSPVPHWGEAAGDAAGSWRRGSRQDPRAEAGTGQREGPPGHLLPASSDHRLRKCLSLESLHPSQPPRPGWPSSPHAALPSAPWCGCCRLLVGRGSVVGGTALTLTLANW